MTYPVAVPDVLIYAGDTYEQTYTFKDTAGDPIDLDAEGWHTWKAQVRPSRDSLDYVDFHVDHSDADQGVIVVSMTAANTSTLSGSGVWDLRAKHSSTIRTFITSRVEITEAVTHVEP